MFNLSLFRHNSIYDYCYQNQTNGIKMNITNMLRILFTCIVFLFIFNSALFGADYEKYVTDITQRLNKAHTLYKNGDTKNAKQVIQLAYFEVFENLEGPIRINISANKSYLMESQFGTMRKLVTRGESPEALRKAVDNLIFEMNEVLPEITNGYQIVAEGIDGEDEENTPEIENSLDILPTWQSAIDLISNYLQDALVKYDPNNSKATRTLIQNAQFDGYRNSGLETAIKKFNSIDRESYIQMQFTNMIHFVYTKPSKTELDKKIKTLISDLREVAPGLGLVSNARVVQAEENVESIKVDYKAVSTKLEKVFFEAIATYKNKNKKQAIIMVQDSYFDIFEASGMENAIGAKNASLKAEIEGLFGKIIALMQHEGSLDLINAEYSRLKDLLSQALNILDNSKGGFLSMFIYSLTIILREGFEALLIVTAIIAYLVKSGNEDRLNLVYSALITAISLSFVTAYVMNIIFGEAAAENRELLEGSVMLVASGLLLYVSYWLISNATAKKWTNYIQNQVKSSLDNSSVKALWFTVFLAVYREGAETVLFYQALIVDASTSIEYTALVGGFFVGVIALIVIYILMKYTAIKLPIKPFFIGTGIFIYAMTFIFVGKGIMELVEGRIFIPTPIEFMPTITMIGIFPYWQTVIPQLIILLLGVLGILKIRKQNTQ